MNDKKYYLTKDGLEKIKKEYKELKEQRKEKLRFEAPEMSYSEDTDSEYLNFKKDLNLLEERILKLEEAMRSAEIIEAPLTDCKEVRLGAEVVIDVQGKEEKIILVGTMEADPGSGKISNESPIGKALFGHKEGDSVAVNSGKNAVYKIKKISYPVN